MMKTKQLLTVTLLTGAAIFGVTANATAQQSAAPQQSDDVTSSSSTTTTVKTIQPTAVIETPTIADAETRKLFLTAINKTPETFEAVSPKLSKLQELRENMQKQLNNFSTSFDSYINFNTTVPEVLIYKMDGINVSNFVARGAQELRSTDTLVGVEYFYVSKPTTDVFDTQVMREYEEVLSSLSDYELSVMNGGSLSSMDFSVLKEQYISSGDEVLLTEMMNRIVLTPNTLTGVENGRLSDEQLCNLSWDTSESLYCPAAEALELLNIDYKRQFGTDIPLISTYRSYEKQEYLHANDPNWTAPAGYSNHSWGLAVDFGEGTFIDYDSPIYTWLIDNSYKYGWLHPNVLGEDTNRPEPWHFEFGTYYEDDTNHEGFHRDSIYGNKLVPGIISSSTSKDSAGK